MSELSPTAGQPDMSSEILKDAMYQMTAHELASTVLRAPGSIDIATLAADVADEQANAAISHGTQAEVDGYRQARNIAADQQATAFSGLIDRIKSVSETFVPDSGNEPIDSDIVLNRELIRLGIYPSVSATVRPTRTRVITPDDISASRY